MRNLVCQRISKFGFIFKPLLLIWLFLPLSVLSAVTQFSFDIFTQENGLPNNQIQCIYQDKKGWMWIGTSQGLSRFDGYTFVNFVSNPLDSFSIQGNLVRVIREDKRGNLLVGTENGGLNVFDRKKERFIHPFKKMSDLRFHDLSVNDIEQDKHGNIWIGTDFNMLVIDTSWNIMEIEPDWLAGDNDFQGEFVRNLQFDDNGNLWVGTNNGLFIYHTGTNTIEPVELPFKDNQNREIWEIYKDDEGLLWVGTYSAGCYVVDPDDLTTTYIKLDPEIERAKTVRTIAKGVLGEFWIGTRGGLYIYSKIKGVTGFFAHDERDPRSLSNSSVLSVFHDAKGETWIGTRGGLNLLAKSKQVFHNFGALPGDNRFLNSSIVYAFWIDASGKIWIGTEDGGINIYNPKSQTYEFIKAKENDPTSISQNCIKAFLDDGNGNLWVGTYLGGIDVINLNTREISHFKHSPSVKGTLSDDRVWDLCTDKNNDIWVATSRGINKYNRSTNSFIHFPQLNGDEKILSIEFDSKGNLWASGLEEVIVYNPEENSVRRFPEYAQMMFEDSRNRIWIATMNKGIALYNSSDGPKKYYDETNGLANNHALCILEDQNNNLWISTTNGISKFDPENKVFQNFTSKDGLGNNQFCYGAGYKSKSSQLLFGSLSGFNLFDPAEIVSNGSEIPIVLTDLKIFNRSVPISDEKGAILKKSISETGELVLNYDQNVFTVEFAALNYVNSANNMYTYMLEGFNKGWNEPSKIRTATYTNLNPGDYILRIRRIIPGTLDNGNELELLITVLPPYWKTNWFLILMFSAILFFGYILVKLFINREKFKNQLVLERLNARKLHELDMMKLKFFTNISHEIRTPLTLILGPLEKMMDNNLKHEEIQNNLKMIHRNASNLNGLINQLLDFRKLQTGNLKLNLTEGDLVGFVRNVVDSFNSLAVEKQVNLRFNTLKKRLFVSFDPDKIEKILNNLLSNAFKFTDSGGTVSVNLSLLFDSDDNDFSEGHKEKQFIEIIVKDTGKGIERKNLNNIFIRFFQGEDQTGGTGIGLALVKELVTLHKGKIFVASTPGKGSRFTIRLPYHTSVDEVNDESAEIDEEFVDETRILSKDIEESSGIIPSKIMLIVEDNSDVRQFISGHFHNAFKIIQAKDGEEGWDLALKIIPDIIVSDIIMPRLDGYELCKRIKSDERTSHIPVLLLTAMHSKEHEIKGLTFGADDYITKPFDLNVLQVKVENVLSIRESLKDKYTGTMILEPTNVVLTSPDERFLHKAIEIVESNISDSELDIEGFAEKVGVSRMQLYRKIHALTNMTVKEFIRHIRLKRATQLLIQQKLTVSEVAYLVGFKDLSHFRKCFKREFGMNATEYISKVLHEDRME